jgi:hypothetical protein
MNKFLGFLISHTAFNAYEDKGKKKRAEKISLQKI